MISEIDDFASGSRFLLPDIPIMVRCLGEDREASSLFRGQCHVQMGPKQFNFHKDTMLAVGTGNDNTSAFNTQ